LPNFASIKNVRKGCALIFYFFKSNVEQATSFMSFSEDRVNNTLLFRLTFF
jgi:hypothetical protein